MPRLFDYLDAPPPVTTAELWATREALMDYLVLLSQLRFVFPAAVTRGALDLAVQKLVNFHIDYGRIAAYADLTA